MWYTRHDHGHERLKMLGLQCLVNFHLFTPTGTLHEVILPCLKGLGQSSGTLIRRSEAYSSRRCLELLLTRPALY